MATPVSDIENEFARLPSDAQLRLLERLVHRARITLNGVTDSWEQQLSAMSADPAVQNEIRRIDLEFKAAEMDGLQKR